MGFIPEKELSKIKKVLSEFISGKWKGWTVFPTTKAYPQKYFVKEKYLPQYAKAIKELSKKEGADVKFFQMSKEFLACTKLYTNNTGLYRIMPGDSYWHYNEKVYQLIWADDKISNRNKKLTTKDFQQYICMIPPEKLNDLKGELKEEIYNDIRKMAHGLIDKVFDEFCKSSKVEAIGKTALEKNTNNQPEQKEKKELLTTKEVAEILPYKEKTIRNIYKKKFMEGVHYIRLSSGKIAFKRSGIEKWLKEKELSIERESSNTIIPFKGLKINTKHLCKK